MLTLSRARFAFKIAAALARAVPFWSLAAVTVVFLATGFLAGAFWVFFATGLPSFLAAGFLAATFFAAGFFSTVFLAGAFFSAGFFSAAGRFAAAGFLAVAELGAVAVFFSAAFFDADFLSFSDSPAKTNKKNILMSEYSFWG